MDNISVVKVISGMDKKRQELIIDPRDFPVFLKARMLHDSVQEFARKLGVTPKLIYMLLNGERKPSAAIQKKMGLEVVYRTVSLVPTRRRK